MLEREKRIELNEFFSKKEETQEKLEHNVLEVKKLKKMFMAEQDDENSAQIKKAIRRGKGLISTQKTEISNLSLPKIARLTGVEYSQVRRQFYTFQRCSVIL